MTAEIKTTVKTRTDKINHPHLEGHQIWDLGVPLADAIEQHPDLFEDSDTHGLNDSRFNYCVRFNPQIWSGHGYEPAFIGRHTHLGSRFDDEEFLVEFARPGDRLLPDRFTFGSLGPIEIPPVGSAASHWLVTAGLRDGVDLAARHPSAKVTICHDHACLEQLKLDNPDSMLTVVVRHSCWANLQCHWAAFIDRLQAHGWVFRVITIPDYGALDVRLSDYSETSVGSVTGDHDQVWPPTTEATEFNVLKNENCAVSSPDYLIKNFLNRNELATLYSKPGVGKSFLALFIAHQLASEAKNILGRRARGCNTLYLCLEGEAGFRNRMEALNRRYGSAPGLAVNFDPLDLTQEHWTDQLEQIAVYMNTHEVGLLIIDTWAQAMPGADESASGPSSRAINHLQRLRQMTGACILVLDHLPWATTRKEGARGWSGKYAAMDAAYLLEGDLAQGSVIVRPHRQKDGNAPGPLYFATEAVHLGADEDGDPITSFCVIEGDADRVSTASRANGGELAELDRAALDIIHGLLSEHGEEGEVSGRLARRISRNKVWNALAKNPSLKSVCDNHSWRSRFLKRLIANDKIVADRQHIGRAHYEPA